MDRFLTRRQWLGAAGMAAAASAVAACGSGDKSSTATTTVTVPAGPDITTETGRPTITDPDAALKQLTDGNLRFVDARMVTRRRTPSTGCRYRRDSTRSRRS